MEGLIKFAFEGKGNQSPAIKGSPSGYSLPATIGYSPPENEADNESGMLTALEAGSISDSFEYPAYEYHQHDLGDMYDSPWHENSEYWDLGWVWDNDTQQWYYDESIVWDSGKGFNDDHVVRNLFEEFQEEATVVPEVLLEENDVPVDQSIPEGNSTDPAAVKSKINHVTHDMAAQYVDKAYGHVIHAIHGNVDLGFHKFMVNFQTKIS